MSKLCVETCSNASTPTMRQLPRVLTVDPVLEQVTTIDWGDKNQRE